MLRLLTAGESHGKVLLAVIDGFPAGLMIDAAGIDRALLRRQGGYGRGGRQKLETDTVEGFTGTWQGTTLGSPVTLAVANRDCKRQRRKGVDRQRPRDGGRTAT